MTISKWTDWPVEIHSEPEQIQRMLEKVAFLEIDTINQIGTTAKGYSTSLYSCTCPDFSKRKRPCKHIYALAADLDLLFFQNQLRQLRRSKILMANFSTGFASDWAFCVGTFHWPCLDIQWSPLKIDGKSTKEPTQGIMYKFDVGQIFYNNNPEIYKPSEPWKKTSQLVRIALQIHNMIDNKREFRAFYEGSTLIVGAKISYGVVSFDVFIYDDGKPTKLGRYYAHADELVQLLQYGYCKGIKDEEEIYIDFTKYI